MREKLKLIQSLKIIMNIENNNHLNKKNLREFFLFYREINDGENFSYIYIIYIYEIYI